jgi:GTP:adenosylcobinamide-phosphate guanylyltransferase
MKFNYIVIQAGGLGTRLGKLTQNKPKGIVPVKNLPIIFHLFKRYPEARFIIICDYLSDVLQKYLRTFASVSYSCVKANGKGTCAGIKRALTKIPANCSFMLTWSDLVFDSSFSAEEVSGNTIGLSGTFPCRWSFANGKLLEEPSSTNGVAGVFFFTKKSVLRSIPDSGEFVRYLSTLKIPFHSYRLFGIKEVGTILAYEREKNDFVCRPFNTIEIQNGKVVKTPSSELGDIISEKEKGWYKHASDLGYSFIPRLFSFSPLTMELVSGHNPFFEGFSNEQKKAILINSITALRKLHSLELRPGNNRDIYQTYYQKTFSRVEKIRNLVPFASRPEIVINGIACKNPLFQKKAVSGRIKQSFFDSSFCFIHGDSTFSNMIVKPDLSIVLIDPRGYFGDTLVYGDPLYDWSKLYYSLKGNYDQFNRKNFSLRISSLGATISIESNGFEFLEETFFSLLPEIDKKKVQFLHSLIWLSLTTYAWEDYDSICGAFYQGTLLFNECLK